MRPDNVCPEKNTKAWALPPTRSRFSILNDESPHISGAFCRLYAGRDIKGQSMEYRTFGNTSLRVSAVGIGCSRLGGTSTSDKEVLATLLGAFDRGINFYDTADVYAQGQSEKFLGATFKRNRAAVVIATKAGYHLTAAGRLGTMLKPFLGPAIRLAAGLRRQAQRIRPTPQDQSFSAQHLMAAIEGS